MKETNKNRGNKNSTSDDRVAFEKVFAEFYPKIKSFIIHSIKSKEDAADLTQELFIKLWQKYSTLDRSQPLDGYVFAIARNLINDYFTKKVNEQKYIEHELHVADKSLDPDGVYQAEELRLLVKLILSNMPKKRKEVFLMSRDMGYTHEQIAEKLNISKRTVEAHIYKALEELKRLIVMLLLFFTSMN